MDLTRDYRKTAVKQFKKILYSYPEYLKVNF